MGGGVVVFTIAVFAAPPSAYCSCSGDGYSRRGGHDCITCLLLEPLVLSH